MNLARGEPTSKISEALEEDVNKIEEVCKFYGFSVVSSI
jgi:hypothetical protein